MADDVLGPHWGRHEASPLGAHLNLTDAEMIQRTVADLKCGGLAWIQAWQYQKAIPIETIARRAKIPLDIAKAIFRNEVFATKDELIRIAAVLGVTVDDLR